MRVLTEHRRKYLHLAVTEARRRLKMKAIAYKGGKCSRCGYDKCPAAFDFHHVDPEQKDFAISGACKSFERIKPELDKTILLCANCHREIHDDEAQVKVQERREELREKAPPLGRPRKTG